MRLVLIGDGESPHLLKWARALAAVADVELWALSSRGFAVGFEACVPAARRLALNTRPVAGGGNLGLLRQLPRAARWLREVRADWLHAHYLTSHGSLAWAARHLGRAPGRLVGSAWGSDILVTPQRGWPWRALTRMVLRDCTLTTSDSQVMAARMRELGAREVMVFPFGLDALPPAPAAKDAELVFANRGLEPIYRPERVLAVFAAWARRRPALRLVVANDGSLRAALQAQAAALGLAERVQFVGRLDAETQAGWYARAQWYVSLPQSDSVAVSVLEAMAHGCIPLLSDLPANRELVQSGDNGLILQEGPEGPMPPDVDLLFRVQQRADTIASENRAWVQRHALFGPAVQAFVERLRARQAAGPAR
ncbi:MAG: glycosyltransferase [Proteobacteria bacterium]|nr:glycosyltransferase [Pseudomonadota bacterium]